MKPLPTGMTVGITVTLNKLVDKFVQRHRNSVKITFELLSGGRLPSMASSGFPGLPDTPLPAALSDGQTAFMMMSYADIGAALVHSGRTGKTKLTPICVDTTDTVHKGEPWDVNPQEFVQMGQ